MRIAIYTNRTPASQLEIQVRFLAGTPIIKELSMIAIVNTGVKIFGNRNEYLYSVRINIKEICKFTHNRDDGLAVCLDKAAEAVRKCEEANNKPS